MMGKNVDGHRLLCKASVVEIRTSTTKQTIAVLLYSSDGNTESICSRITTDGLIPYYVRPTNTTKAHSTPATATAGSEAARVSERESKHFDPTASVLLLLE